MKATGEPTCCACCACCACCKGMLCLLKCMAGRACCQWPLPKGQCPLHCLRHIPPCWLCSTKLSWVPDACRVAKLGELNTVSEGVPVDYGSAGVE